MVVLAGEDWFEFGRQTQAASEFELHGYMWFSYIVLLGYSVKGSLISSSIGSAILMVTFFQTSLLSRRKSSTVFFQKCMHIESSHLKKVENLSCTVLS